MRLDAASFAVIDFETTGLFPYSGDKICEIGAVRTGFRAKRMKKFHSLVDPKRPISYGAFAVNGITDDMVKGKPTIDRILPAFMEFVKDSVLVAYNAGFDLGFLESALGSDSQALKDYYVIDVLGLARTLFPRIGRYNLGAVAASLGISSPVEHRAMADAYMAWKVFENELGLLINDGVTTVEDIACAQRKKAAPMKTVKDYRIKLIEEAIKEQRKLNIVYHSFWTNTVTKRTVTPKEIEFGYDKAYLVAHCHLKNEERNFRLDCIIDAKVLR